MKKSLLSSIFISPSRGSEKSIREKEQQLFKDTMIGICFLVILLMYLSLNYTTYRYFHVRTSFTEALGAATQMIAQNPFYFWPLVPGALKNAIGIGFFTFLVGFLYYSLQRVRLSHTKTSLKGTTEWGNLREYSKIFSEPFGEISNSGYPNFIYSKNLSISMNSKATKTLNSLIIGSTGQGKSRFYLKPNLLQMNCSYAITDPSGGVLQQVGETLFRFGYNIRIFDLITMRQCCTYNPMKYCHAEADIKILVESFIANTKEKGEENSSKDPFWDNSMNAFLCAIIALLISYGDDPMIMDGKKYEKCFSNLCVLTRMASQPLDREYLMDETYREQRKTKLGHIFHNIARQYPLDSEKPYCLREWENFKLAPEKTATTVLMTAAVRLDAFNIDKVRDLTSTDTIDLESLGDQRDALFIITPVSDTTYNFLAAFMYTQMFNWLYHKGETLMAGSRSLKLESGELVRHFSAELPEDAVNHKIDAIRHSHIEEVVVREADKSGNLPRDAYYEILDEEGEVVSRRPTVELANEYLKELQKATLQVHHAGAEALPEHFRFLLDEFPNLGEIPHLQQRLATMRKYRISCDIICQSITQLKGLYPDDYEVIDANCQQTVFLGGDENTNNEYLSKKIGTETVIGGNLSVDNKRISNSMNLDSRELMKPEELGRIPDTDMIVLISGHQPVYDKKYDYTKHPRYQYTHDAAVDLGSGQYVFNRNRYPILHGVQTIWDAKPTHTLMIHNLDEEKDNVAGLFRRFLTTNDSDALRNQIESGSVFGTGSGMNSMEVPYHLGSVSC